MVGVVLVSHSRDLAQGLAAVAAQMAPNVRIAPAGGTDDGGDRHVVRAHHGRHRARPIPVTARWCCTTSAADISRPPRRWSSSTPDQQQRVVIVDAPFVEGAVSAAIAAQIGGDLRAVIAAALEARTANGPGGVREPG